MWFLLNWMLHMSINVILHQLYFNLLSPYWQYVLLIMLKPLFWGSFISHLHFLSLRLSYLQLYGSLSELRLNKRPQNPWNCHESLYPFFWLLLEQHSVMSFVSNWMLKMRVSEALHQLFCWFLHEIGLSVLQYMSSSYHGQQRHSNLRELSIRLLYLWQ